MENKKRGLDSLISENLVDNDDKKKYTKTIGFKVSERQYETYKRYSKYFGNNNLLNKWRTDIDNIKKEKGKDLESIENEIIKRLNKN
ncbi:MAG: hypothetical protein ARM1_0632 [Candidatus Micrarchaeota archaeon]|nr:MAG: hypothetical protein ARM1_0632 [Candidatus Micrarchaeota archaeon]